MKVAIVDLGTNTCRLFLARVEDGRVLQDARVTTVVRLGQGVDKTGRLHPDAVHAPTRAWPGTRRAWRPTAPRGACWSRRACCATPGRAAVPARDRRSASSASRGACCAGRRRPRSPSAAAPRGSPPASVKAARRRLRRRTRSSSSTIDPRSDNTALEREVKLLTTKAYIAQRARSDANLVPRDTQLFVIKGLPGKEQEVSASKRTAPVQASISVFDRVEDLWRTLLH